MIAIVDYGAGNLFSVARALHYLGEEATITSDEKILLRADKIIIPGVGRAGAAMSHLTSSGLDQVLKRCHQEGRCLLGICIGIQLILDHSEEDDVDCLGFIPGQVKRFSSLPAGMKVPQIGWNEVCQVQNHPLFEGIPSPAHFYFVNSYYPLPRDSGAVIAETEYGLRFASAVASGGLVATQFHLEKSGPLGLQMLQNFCGWRG